MGKNTQLTSTQMLSQNLDREKKKDKREVVIIIQPISWIS